MLVFFILAFLIGVTLVALRHQMAGMKELAQHDAANDEYWRAHAFASDLEASLRADVVGAYHEEARQARLWERKADPRSRLPVFDLPGEPRPSRAFAKIPSPNATWFDARTRLKVPAVELTGEMVDNCTSLFGRFAETSWLTSHRILPLLFAARRGWDVERFRPIIELKLVYQDSEQQPIPGGYPMVTYVLEFLVEASTGREGEYGAVRKQGRITLEAAGGQICPDPSIVFVKSNAAGPVDEGSTISFDWETDSADGMQIEVIGTDNLSKGVTPVIFPRRPDASYAQTNATTPWTIAATIEDPDAETGTMTFRFSATSACSASPSREVVITVTVRRFVLAGWAAPWSQPRGEGLRASDRGGDLVGFFQTWAEVRAEGDRLQFRVRVGYVLGEESGRKLDNGQPVRDTFSGVMTLTDADGRVVDGMTGVALNLSSGPNVKMNYVMNQFMRPPSRGCDPGHCVLGFPNSGPGSVMMPVEFVWSLPRPAGEIKGYRLSFLFDVRTIDPFRSRHRLYSRRGGSDNDPFFPAEITLAPRRPPAGSGSRVSDPQTDPFIERPDLRERGPAWVPPSWINPEEIYVPDPCVRNRKCAGLDAYR